MTAVPYWDIAGDADLACAAATGDRGAFAGIYDRYADRLYDFCVGMLRDREAAADCVQDVFCTAAERLDQLRDPEKLRPWLYAIARNEALRQIRERRRERVYEDVPEVLSDDVGPDILAAHSELADLIATAAGGLTDRDRTALDLAYRHGLDGPELAEALGISHANAKKINQRLRETIQKSLGALLIARRARNNTMGCAGLAAILDGWDGHFSVLIRKRISRHIDSCATCDDERRRMVNPVALLGGAPVFIPAPDWLRDRTLNDIDLTASGSRLARGDNTNRVARGRGEATRPMRRAQLTALVAAAVLVVVATIVAWLYRPKANIGPVDTTINGPQPTSASTVLSSAAPVLTTAPPAAPLMPDPSTLPAVTPQPSTNVPRSASPTTTQVAPTMSASTPRPSEVNPPSSPSRSTPPPSEPVTTAQPPGPPPASLSPDEPSDEPTPSTGKPPILTEPDAPIAPPVVKPPPTTPTTPFLE